MKFFERIKVLRKKKGVTQQDIATFVNVSKTAVSRWELGHSTPSGERLRLLAKKLECSEEYLLTGETVKTHSALIENVVFLDFYDNKYPIAEEISSIKDLIKVPVSKNVIEKQGNSQDLLCMRVKGASMSPVLLDNSIVAFNLQSKKIVDGDMYVISQEGFLRVKILIEEPKQIVIRSYNEQFGDEIHLKNADEDFNIIGKIFWHVSSV